MRRMLLTLAGVAAAVALTSTQAARVDGFRGTVVNVDGQSGIEMKVDVLRWSTDAERQQVVDALADPAGMVQDVLRGLETVGYIWVANSQVGLPVRYAYADTLPDGSERIVVASDRRLGQYHIRPWTVDAVTAAPDLPYTVVELRLTDDGEGVGKMSLATGVVADPAGATIALDGYDAAPIVLEDVRRDS